MKKAIRYAGRSLLSDDVPIGCVIVKNNKIIGYGYNKKEELRSPIAHAEIMAIKMASKNLNSYHLEGCDIYVTLEPCLMCVGAILNARIKNLYFGARNKRFGAVISHQKIEKLITNHKISYESGILERECASLISNFFSDLRKRSK
ncbi:nucleoside deaminase [Peptoniphilus gorbachii]|uniref:tRNA-specific adenosine deaminase n=1 Tax=Peptoniphilus gorbachii TaxID=411567 RepID=A0ABS2MLK8_9FIRM|nr:nucleoside deaminase [Peptoniphilus gorbachii]MBM7550900.1 tRNA(adenine34) deaminase [Peptoniphilus gorbachii]